MDKLSIDDDKEQGHPSPLAFDVFMPWACSQLQIEATIVVIKVLQPEYVSKFQNQTDRSKSRKNKPQQVPSRSEAPDSLSNPDLSVSGFQSTYAERIVKILTTYDTSDKLVQIKFDKNKVIPQKIIKILSLIIQFHPYLNSLTINCGLDANVMHELCKLQCLSNITNIFLDGTCYDEASFDALLDKQSPLKQLSLARCKINDDVIKKIASKLVHPLPASQMLSILNLSSNRITNAGAQYLAETLRSNCFLSYLNLADNSIDDEGADCILKSLQEFPITHEEQLGVRSKHMEYLKAKKDMIKIMLIEAKAADLDKKANKRKALKQPVSSTPRKSKAMEKELSMKSLLDRSIVNTDGLWHEKAQAMAENAMGPFKHPFSKMNTVVKDGVVYCTGNNTLCCLNLAYNNLSYYTVKRLLHVLIMQKLSGRKPRGLVNVSIEGNCLPISCIELVKIDELLAVGSMAPERKQSLIKKKSVRD